MKGGENSLDKKLIFTVVGGDMRQVFLAKQLSLDLHEVFSFAIDRYSFPDNIKQLSIPDFSETQVIILPMPTEREKGILNAPLCNTSHKTSNIFDSIPAKTHVFAGGVTEDMKIKAEQNNIFLFDYLSREELAILNAIPTCEGAIQLAMEEMPITLHGAKVLVIGNGRIGSMLAHDLSSLHCEVTISARSPKDFALIKAQGLNHLHTNYLTGKLSYFDLIINTVPAPVMRKAELVEINDNTLIIDLASRPGGVDFKSAENLGKRAIHALSLPGKVAPVSSALAIKNTIYTILQEEGML